MPVIVVLCGPPCSGKSAVAESLVRDHPEFEAFAHVEMDQVRLAFIPESHTPEDRNLAYEKMHDLAAEALLHGRPGAILVATYQPTQHRRAVQVLADSLSATLLVFECKAHADDAVKRFNARPATHAAVDLSAEKVWDLAQDFVFSAGTVLLDTSALELAELTHIVAQSVRAHQPIKYVEAWIAAGNPPRQPTHSRDKKDESEPAKKLTAKSRNAAKWALRRRWVLYIASATSAVVGVGVLIKAFLGNLSPRLRELGLSGSAADWVQVWGVLAGLAALLGGTWDYLFESAEAKLKKSISEVGRIPRLEFLENRESNAQVYRRYFRRIDPTQRPRMLIPSIPLWFLVGPEENGFEVSGRPCSRHQINTSLLQERAAQYGLDWHGYLKWRKRDKEEQYTGRYEEQGVRLLGMTSVADGLNLDVCVGDFVSYICTEQSAHLSVEGKHGFELRQIFEGSEWQRSASPSGFIDLTNLSQARETYEMLIGVQVALTTSDGYLVLQRRSDMVWAATGGAAASAAGSAQWKDTERPYPLLTATALREAEEEIGWKPAKGDDLRNPFLGAAFNLSRGRDLNFYCHFHTNRTLSKVSRAAPKARDSWEVAHLIPVPLSDVLPEGRLSERFEALLRDARHVRGLIYCLAQSARFRGLRQQFGTSSRDHSQAKAAAAALQ